MELKVQKKNLGKKKEKKELKKINNEIKKVKEIKVEKEVEMQGFSGGEILRGRYPLAWQMKLCYEYGGIGHK